MGEIYVAECKESGKCYVGQAKLYSTDGRKHGMDGRIKTHMADLGRKKPGCPLLTNAIRKYGEDAFEWRVILTCALEELDENEAKYIKHYNSVAPHGYNLHTGGLNGRVCSEEMRRRMSVAQQARIKDEPPKPPKFVPSTAEDRILVPQRPGKRTVSRHTEAREAFYEEMGITALPQYVVYTGKNSQGTGEGFIVRFPGRGGKSFTSMKYTLEEKYYSALNYLTDVCPPPAAGSPASQQ